VKVKEILTVLRDWAPESFQESYDNSGLIVGNPDSEVNKALVSLDCTEAVVDEALATGCSLIISHHPIVFSGLKRFNGSNYIERVVEKAIKNDICLYAIHTNLDNVNNGVNAKIMELIGVKNPRVLAPKKNMIKKLEFFSPKDATETVFDALCAAGAGEIGNYSGCSFRLDGEGTFRPEKGSNPVIGEQGVLTRQQEDRVEMVFPAHRQNAVLKALFDAHPYEEVAYQVLSLENIWQEVGSGMVGNLEQPEPVMDFLKRIKEVFGTGCVKYTQPHVKMVERVAVCGGSGSFLLGNAMGAKADVFITADYKYHQFFDAEKRIVIADIGHYESEKFTMQLISDYLSEKIPNFATCLTKSNTNPVHYL